MIYTFKQDSLYIALIIYLLNEMLTVDLILLTPNPQPIISSRRPESAFIHSCPQIWERIVHFFTWFATMLPLANPTK